MSPADELRAAIELLPDEPLHARVIEVPDEDPKLATRHTVVACPRNHLEIHDELRLDAFGCCCECQFLASYDPGFAAFVVALLNAADSLGVLMDFVAAQYERGKVTSPASRHAAAVARAMLGSQP